MNIVHRQVTMTAVDGKKFNACLSVCGRCDGEDFMVIMIDHNFEHLQCSNCNALFCNHKGPCGEYDKKLKLKEEGNPR